MKEEEDFFKILLRLELECPICGEISKIGRQVVKKNIEGFYICKCGYHISYFDLKNDLKFIKDRRL